MKVLSGLEMILVLELSKQVVLVVDHQSLLLEFLAKHYDSRYVNQCYCLILTFVLLLFNNVAVILYIYNNG